MAGHYILVTMTENTDGTWWYRIDFGDKSFFTDLIPRSLDDARTVACGVTAKRGFQDTPHLFVTQPVLLEMP